MQPQGNGNSVQETNQIDFEDAILEKSFLSSTAEQNAFEHLVQFYEEDDYLLNSLSEFTKSAFQAGEPVLIIANQTHRENLGEKLMRSGIDLDAARRGGHFTDLDAGQTLAGFLVGGEIDEALFTSMIGGLIAQVSKGKREVRVFGEMVALLLSEGNHQAAVRLEKLWNDLSKTHSFSLLCAYPLGNFDEQMLSSVLGEICHEHSHLIPAESFSAVREAGERNRTIIELQRKARQFENEIAERKKIEQERAGLLAREHGARLRAEEANRMKDEFLATISHELRTPLNAIIGWSHLLREKELDKQTTLHAIETIENNARSQAQLIEDILDLSHVITGKLRLNIKPIDIAAIINSAVDSVECAANSKNIYISVTLDTSARHVLGDSTRLQQVIWNLLSNAVKFTPAGGRVKVRLERSETGVQICVSDTGKGIKSEFLPFIFDSFSQGDGSCSRQQGGLGLGLALVRHLVELHGGSVSVESEGEDRGATFTITLPQTTAKKKIKQPKRNFKTPFGAGEHTGKFLPLLENLRVLVVDANADSLEMLAILLTGYKAEVRTALSAVEALATLEVFQPDLILSDIAMPGEDGYSLIRKIRAAQMRKTRRIPAIALTSYTRAEDRAQALQAGFDMFVPKPVEPNELVIVIASLTANKANTEN